MEITETFVVNSVNRTSGDSRDFTHTIDLSRSDYTHVSVMQLYIPKTFYVLEAPHNVFYLT